MTFTCHTAVNQSTVDQDAPHMAEWPVSVPLPASLLVENVRTDKPDYFGSDDFGDVAEWDEPADIDSVVTLVMENGAKVTMTAPELGDCMDPEFEYEGEWDKWDTEPEIEEIVENILYTALSDARNEAIDEWKK